MFGGRKPMSSGSTNVSATDSSRARQVEGNDIRREEIFVFSEHKCFCNRFVSMLRLSQAMMKPISTRSINVSAADSYFSQVLVRRLRAWRTSQTPPQTFKAE